jgi:hypothetical protein
MKCHIELTEKDTENFACDVCGGLFHIRRNLKCHMVVHTGERPYG